MTAAEINEKLHALENVILNAKLHADDGRWDRVSSALEYLADQAKDFSERLQQAAPWEDNAAG